MAHEAYGSTLKDVSRARVHWVLGISGFMQKVSSILRDPQAVLLHCELDHLIKDSVLDCLGPLSFGERRSARLTKESLYSMGSE